MSTEKAHTGEPLSAAGDWAGVLVVVPSISPDLVRTARGTLGQLTSGGADVVVAANSIGVSQLPESEDFRLVNLGRNAGYSAAINAAAKTTDTWTWLLVLNDDLDLSINKMLRVRDSLKEGPGPVLIFDGGPWRSPRFRVFLDLSLLTSTLDRLLPRRRAWQASTYPGRFKEFSAFAIRRDVWSEVGPLNEQQVFWYEDAEYCGRVERAGRGPIVSLAMHLSKERSVTTSRHLVSVFLVGVRSARNFLELNGRSAFGARLVVTSALLLRMVLAPFARTHLRTHYAAITKAIRSTLLNSEVHLPDYHRL